MYIVSVLVEKEDKHYVSHCIELDIASQGPTVDEAIKNLREAVTLYLKHADVDELEHLKKAHSQAPLMTTMTVGA